MNLPPAKNVPGPPPLPVLSDGVRPANEAEARTAFRLALLGAGQVIGAAGLLPLLLFGHWTVPFGRDVTWVLHVVATALAALWGFVAVVLQLVAAGRGVRRWRHQLGWGSALLAPAGWLLALVAFAATWIMTGAFMLP